MTYWLVMLRCGDEAETYNKHDAANAIAVLVREAKERGVATRDRHVTVVVDGKHLIGPCAPRYAYQKVTGFSTADSRLIVG